MGLSSALAHPAASLSDLNILLLIITPGNGFTFCTSCVVGTAKPLCLSRATVRRLHGMGSASSLLPALSHPQGQLWFYGPENGSRGSWALGGAWSRHCRGSGSLGATALRKGKQHQAAFAQEQSWGAGGRQPLCLGCVWGSCTFGWRLRPRRCLFNYLLYLLFFGRVAPQILRSAQCLHIYFFPRFIWTPPIAVPIHARVAGWVCWNSLLGLYERLVPGQRFGCLSLLSAVSLCCSCCCTVPIAWCLESGWNGQEWNFWEEDLHTQCGEALE